MIKRVPAHLLATAALLVHWLLAGAAFAAVQSAPVQSADSKPSPDSVKSLLAKAKLLNQEPSLAFETNWLIGDGTIQDAVGGKGKTPASGSLGVRHESVVYQINAFGDEREASIERFVAFYGFGTSVDTVQGDRPVAFAAAILPPSVVGRRLSFFGDYSHLWPLPKRVQRLEQQHGFRIYGGMAKMTWAFDSIGTTVADDVVLYSAGARYVVVPINRSHEDNPVVFAVETGPTARWLDYQGDNKARLRALASGGKARFIGWDLLATLQVRSLVASLCVPLFDGNGKAAGLRDAGPIVQVGIQTGLLKLNDDERLRDKLKETEPIKVKAPAAKGTGDKR